MKTKNEQKNELLEYVKNNAFPIFFGTIVFALFATFIVLVFISIDYRTYEEKLEDYQAAKSACLETGLDEDMCTIFAWKESGLDNE